MLIYVVVLKNLFEYQVLILYLRSLNILIYFIGFDNIPSISSLDSYQKPQNHLNAHLNLCKDCLEEDFELSFILNFD